MSASEAASTLISFGVVTLMAVATYGITSTLPIGLAIAAGFAFIISELFFALMRWIDRRRSD